MHDCQKYREDWIENPRWTTDCDDCRLFCNEAQTVLAAFDAAAPSIPESGDYWTRFDIRLQAKLIDENFAKRVRVVRQRWVAAFGVAASVVIAVTWGSLHLSGPIVNEAGPAVRIESDHIEGLDPRVVEFMGQSEMFVRDFTKIEPLQAQDIADARSRASRSLASIAEKKQAAADFAPARITLDEYESVLRDIKNLDSPQDIYDIQNRIKRNGLIANLKAYQPRIVLATLR
jgi:hypothetical protein